MAVTAIDFDQGMGLGSQNYIMFMPDGSSQDTLGNYNSGVLYHDPSQRSLQFTRHLGLRYHRKSSRLAALQPKWKHMGATMKQGSQTSRQDGFSILETMIAIAILGIGIVSVLAAFGTAVAATQYSQENLIARQKALEAMESIYTARNTQQIPFRKSPIFLQAESSPTGRLNCCPPGPTDW